MDASTRLVLFDLVICGCIACFLTAGSSVYMRLAAHKACMLSLTEPTFCALLE